MTYHPPRDAAPHPELRHLFVQCLEQAHRDQELAILELMEGLRDLLETIRQWS